MQYETVAKVFGNEAETYDLRILRSLSSRLAYSIALEYLLSCFKGDEIVLDIGCGTGLQAIPLAQKGCEIVAIDVSDGMLNVLKRKIDKLNLRNIRLYKISAGKIGELIKIFGKEYFDGAYSFFGVLNAEPNLNDFAQALYTLLKKNGIFLSLTINRWCIYSLIFLKPRPAVSMYKNIIYRLYTPTELRKIFYNFKIDETIGIRIIIPYQGSRMDNTNIIGFLYKIEKYISGVNPLKYLGSEIMIKFLKV